MQWYVGQTVGVSTMTTMGIGAVGQHHSTVCMLTT